RASPTRIDTSSSSARASLLSRAYIAGRPRLRTCSGKKHERRQACAVVVHRDAQVLDSVVDSTELDPAQLRHLPHLPLHHLAKRILGPVHMAFRDVSAVVVVPEAVRDARGNRLALPASLLGEDAMGDRAHREVSPPDRSDAHREDRRGGAAAEGVVETIALGMLYASSPHE